MRRVIFLLAIAALVSVPAAALASNIANTKHNLSASGSGRTIYQTAGVGADQMCVYCHTPHGGDQAAAPLWNRTVNSTGFTMYTSTTINMTRDSAPTGSSLACLSCHDGTIGFDSLLNKPGSGNGAPSGFTFAGSSGNKMPTSSAAYLGKDLTNDHPISIAYNQALDSDFKATPTAPITLDASSKVQCSSCHNPHDDQYGTFLRMSNAGSAICLSCHVK